jgi:uncharacterized phage-associated protein
LYYAALFVSSAKRLKEDVMIINYDREKLINAIIYFAEATSVCGKIKLFKLLYFLDFEHYKETGRSVTGLEYYAWKMGPVPSVLMDEIDMPEPDMAERVTFEPIPTKFGNNMIQVRSKAKFDSSHFTKRELRILKDLADRYVLSKAEEMIEATHIETLPWHRVYHEEHRKQGLIPYEYALKPEEKEAVLDIASENKEIIENYR